MTDTQPVAGGVLLTGAEYERYRQQDAQKAALVDAAQNARNWLYDHGIGAEAQRILTEALAATGKEVTE